MNNAVQSIRSAIILGAFVSSAAIGAFAQEGAAPKVAVSAAYTDEIEQDIKFIGRGEAVDKVNLVARVSGFLEEKLFDDGAFVNKGDVLYVIESDTYNATLSAREADYHQAVANLKLSEIELERKTELFKRQAGTEADRDIAEANNQSAKAQIDIAQSAIDLAKLDVSYTKIVAPFSGRVGRSRVSVGELVGPSSEPLITLILEAPVYVEFSLTEKQMINVMSEFDATSGEVANNPKAPSVYVILPTGRELKEVGKIVFADNQINPATGAITIRAQFENTENLIIDGSYLQVRIEASEPVKVLMIPLAAVQRDQRGDFVLVVGAEQNVEQRYVTLGRQVETAVVVEDGMREGEAVIVEGLQRVRPGVAVDAVAAGTSALPEGDDAASEDDASSEPDASSEEEK